MYHSGGMNLLVRLRVDLSNVGEIGVSWLNPKGPYLSLENEKDNFCFVLTYSIKRVCEIRKSHVAFMEQRLRNLQTSVMHGHSCFWPI